MHKLFEARPFSVSRSAVWPFGFTVCNQDAVWLGSSWSCSHWTRFMGLDQSMLHVNHWGGKLENGQFNEKFWKTHRRNQYGKFIMNAAARIHVWTSNEAYWQTPGSWKSKDSYHPCFTKHVRVAGIYNLIVVKPLVLAGGMFRPDRCVQVVGRELPEKVVLGCLYQVCQVREMCITFRLDEINFNGFHDGFGFSTGFSSSADRQPFVVVLQVTSEFSLLESRLGNFIIKAKILTTQQEFICLSC